MREITDVKYEEMYRIKRWKIENEREIREERKRV